MKLIKLTFDNVQISAGKGMFIAYARGINFINGCKITNTRNASKYIETQYNADITGDYTGATNGISKVEDSSEDNQTDNGKWYDISGRLLSSNPSHSGIYIHNHKKMIVK